MSSSAEAEIGALFHNTKAGGLIRVTLEEMEHSQKEEPMQIDKSTIYRIVNDTIQEKRTKDMDMSFYWVQNRTCQGHYNLF